MNLKKRQIDDIVIFEMNGKIVGGPDATMLNDQVHELLEAGHKKFIVNLSGVEWMNSSGLGILISGITTIRNAGGELKLAAMTDKIKRLLVITKLLAVFESYNSVDEAVAKYQQ